MNIGKFFVKPKVIFAIIIALVIILAIEAVVITVIIRRQLEIMNPQETGTPTQGTTLGTEPTVPTEPTEPTIPTVPTDPLPTEPPVTTYTVTFVDHDGTVLKTEKVEEGSAATAPSDPTRQGYTFEGWDQTFDHITSDLVVTATYKAVVVTYTVTFKDHDGTVLKTQKVEKGKAATAPSDPIRQGYIFTGWDKSLKNITADLVITATYKLDEPTVYTVTFRDHDGTVLKTEQVEKGKSATAPADPVRENFTFAGWDKAYNNITSDLVVTASYTTSKIVISAESITVNPGTNEVTVHIRVYNNPGIMGAVLKITVDDQVFSFVSGSKNGYPGLTLTSPGPSTTSSPYTFMLDAMELSADDRKDGILFSVTFKIEKPDAAGTYEVKLSCNNKSIFDESYNYPDVTLENGVITIK